MKVFEALSTLPPSPSDEKSVVTIGNFDGVHLGHRSLLQTLVQEAQLRHLRSVVLTFDPHPVQVLYPERKLLKIFAREDQTREMEKLGVDTLIIEPFTKKLSKLSAEAFLRDLVMETLRPQLLIVGYDFSFGANRSGSIPELLHFAREWGFELMIIPPQKIGEEVISSSLIRKTVLSGNMGQVRKLLDRPFYVQGPVESGAQRGRTIGVPTANLKYAGDLLLPSGVYITQSLYGGKIYPSVTNVGTNPTVTETADIKIETHILDFHEDIYYQPLKVEFLHKLRDEKKFTSLEELKTQIKIDILHTKEFFAKGST